ncbi:hypothetical protein CBM2626_B130196 [Cupriavidus taiwanensis]|nr:hypothetical protein CBM2626_B130196 [Cupriavidus taiwanensis]
MQDGKALTPHFGRDSGSDPAKFVDTAGGRPV